MIWKNKGHELDLRGSELVAQNPQKKYYIFGAGLLGKELMPVLQAYGCLTAFIDNSAEKQREGIKGVPVLSLETYLSFKDGQIVIAASPENTIQIREQMEGYSLKYGQDFFLYDEFINYVFPIISVYSFGKSYVALAQITLTERCTLKCKKCAHGCFAVDNSSSEDLSLTQACKSADSFFKKVDFIKEFVLIGGEPFLYKNLAQIIEYIGERYRHQIGIYAITTNGTIVPEDAVLRVCRKYKILIRISNYTRQLPRLKEFVKRLTHTLEENDIPFFLGDENSEWIDYGFGCVERKSDQENLIKVFDDCQTPCREIRENRFYFCVMARSVSDNLKFNVGQQDYLDLDALTGEDYKKKLLEFTLGYSDKGYLDMCRYCNGAEAKKYPIPAAEQVKRDGT